MYGTTAILLLILIIACIMLAKAIFALLTRFKSTELLGRVSYMICDFPYKAFQSIDGIVKNRAAI